MHIRNITTLQGFLIGALLALQLSSSAHADVSLEEALDTAGSLSWTTTNTLSWFGQTDMTHDGVDAAASPTLTNNNTSATFQALVTGPGTVSYWWKISSKTNSDRLTFSMNGAVQTQISGEVDWQMRSFAVPAGSQLLRFVYQKNASISAGQDRAWVDQVQFNGPALVVNCASNKTVTCGSAWAFDPPSATQSCDGSNVTVHVSSTTTNNVTGPCGYQAIRTWLIVDSCTNQTTCAQTVTVVDSNPACTYALSPTNGAFGSASATGIVSVTTASGCAWNVSNTNAWVSILSGASGSGSGTVLYQVAANPNTPARTGNLLIANRLFVVTQSGSGTNPPPTNCVFVLSQSYATHGAAMSTGLVSVTTQAGCSWEVFSSNPWIHALPSFHIGTDTVIYGVDANPLASSRTGFVLIAGQNFPVTQSGSSNAVITLTLAQALDTEGKLVWTTGGSASWIGQTTVTHDGVDAAESGPTPDSGTSYMQTVVTGPGALNFWWKVSTEEDPNDDHRDRLRFDIDGVEMRSYGGGEGIWNYQDVNISGGSHTLRWSYVKDASGSAGQDRGWVDQVQYAPNDCTITITPSSRTHSAAPQSATVSVYVPAGCEWGIVNTNTWISSIPNIGGVSNSVQYTVTSNTSTSSRSGALIIGGQPFVVAQLGATNAPCTYSVSPTNRVHGYGATSNSITLATAAGCPWSVINTNPWLSIPLTSGSGSVPISYFVAANNSTSPRSGYVSVANKLVFISQNGAPGATNSGTNCSIALTPSNHTHDFASSTGIVSVSTSSNCTWNVIKTNTWINVVSSETGIGNGTVVYTVTDNLGGTVRIGYITIGGQTFTVTQTGIPPILSTTPVNIPPVEVMTIGHLSSSSNSVPGHTNGTQSGYFVHNYLIDQGHVSDGGAVLPDIAVNWDTNTQFTITVTAPAGKKFAVEVPTGGQVGFAGFLWWESTRGGFSPGGITTVHFENLEGAAPEFSAATPVLSDSHGFFGFMDLEGTTVTNRFAFSSLTLTGSVTAKFTGNGTENYIPHLGSTMQIYCSTTDTNDPGQFVFIVPAGPLPMIQMMSASANSGVALTVYGIPGRTQVVECSPDTVTWTQIASGVIPPSGSMQVRDASTTQPSGSRFYRTVERSNTNPTSTQ